MSFCLLDLVLLTVKSPLTFSPPPSSNFFFFQMRNDPKENCFPVSLVQTGIVPLRVTCI